MRKSPRIAYTLFRAAVLGAAFLTVSVFASSPPRYAVEPILRALSADQVAAFSARAQYLASGAPEHLSAYRRATAALRSDVDALSRLRGWGEDVQRLRQARRTTEGLLIMMDAEVVGRRHA